MNNSQVECDTNHDDGVSVLELLLYIVIAAALVLAAWFGLNILLDRGEVSTADQNLSSAYKIAKVGQFDQARPEFPDSHNMKDLIEEEFGSNVSITSDYSALNEKQMTVSESGSDKFVAAIRIKGNKVRRLTIQNGAPQPMKWETVSLDSNWMPGLGNPFLTLGEPADNSSQSDVAQFGLMFNSDKQLECLVDTIGVWQTCSQAPPTNQTGVVSVNIPGTPLNLPSPYIEYNYLPAGSNTFYVRKIGGSQGWSYTWNIVAGVHIAIRIPSRFSDPTISGNFEQGQTLTANPGGWRQGSFTPDSFAYQWKSNTGVLGLPVNIPGATNQNYTVNVPNGKEVWFTVTATNAAGSRIMESPRQIIGTSPPENISVPTISGNASPGQILTANPGGWRQGSFTPTNYTYQWRANTGLFGQSANIVGATNSTYTVNVPVGRRVWVSVVATNTAGSAPVVNSANRTVVSP